MQPEVPPRRLVLRGALALGCGLLAPISLVGCDSKKAQSSTASPPTNSPATPAANKKMAQVDVQYQNQPKGDQKCAGCQNFIAESNTCLVVEGQVSPEGWCSLWTKKS